MLLLPARRRVLLEAPSLPMPAVRQFLKDLCGTGPDGATLALLAARDIIDQRPPSRQQVKQLGHLSWDT